MTELLAKAESYLIEEACEDGGAALFGDPTELVAWVILAETCKLDVFLAHAERFMIQLHVDSSFWQGALARGCGGISEQCFMRVLRGALHGKQTAIKSAQTLQKQLMMLASQGKSARCNDCAGKWKYCGGNCVPSAKRRKAEHDALDIPITTLTEWHKQDS